MIGEYRIIYTMDGGNMGNNPKRTPENRVEHDNMIRTVALTLQKQGFYVQADHVYWINGAPISRNGMIPDIVATNNYGSFIVEVEDCSTYSDEYTREQLAAFSKVQGYGCCLIVPDRCPEGPGRHNMKNHIKGILESWGLAGIYIGLYDSRRGSVKFINR